MIDEAIVINNLPAPSLSTLTQSGFTLMGTTLDHRFTESQINSIAAWVGSVHANGLRAFIKLSTKMDPTTAATWVKKAASMGADVIMLDEILGRYGTTQKQLQTIIDNGLKANPTLQFIVNEYSTQDVTNAYSWTSQYSSVRVSTDDYYHTSKIDLGIQLAQQYGKRALVWLIFSEGSQNFDCYLNLDAWIAYVNQKGVDAAFWWVDPAGTWQQQWAKVESF